eukprot:augustus_masked-scaffold_2-processed-gene-7.1-mRNA-1 protein AED:0.17 eAED:0.19 QI:0/-1/0/1/-1/1/1/0/228
MLSSGTNLKYVAVARSSDQVIIASYVADKNDLNRSSYLSSVEEVLKAPDFQYKVSQGSRYRLSGEVNAFYFTIDNNQLVYACIAAMNYPERLVFPMLNKIASEFSTSLGQRSLTAGTDELSKSSEKIFAKNLSEYEKPEDKDKLSSVMSKVEDVKMTMHDNIDGMMRNLDHSEQVEQTTAKLHEQAKIFDSQARTIKRQEQWKNIKLSLIIGGIALLVLILIIVSAKN